MKQDILSASGLDKKALPAIFTGCNSMAGAGAPEKSISPIDNTEIFSFAGADKTQTTDVIHKAKDGFEKWRRVPMPKRKDILLLLAEAFQENADSLARLMTLEMGKPLTEAVGEVMNVADTFAYAASLSRSIGGVNVASTRNDVSLQEVWHPLGPVLIITAFNFPYALWAWNAALAVLCGNSIIWKPAPQTPLCAIAMHHIIADVLKKNTDVPEGVFNMIIGDVENVASPLVNHPDIPLVSATGSVPMGKLVAEQVGKRLGRTILELGGNAAVILTPSADMSTAIANAFFSATLVGGQRCTALRRLLVHESLLDETLKRLKSAYSSCPIGDVFEDKHRLCPLVDDKAKQLYENKIKELEKEGVDLWRPNTHLPDGGCYVAPYMALLPKDAPQPQDETFGPLLYVQPYSDFDKAIEANNAVPQGLSSGIYGTDMREIQQFIADAGSDAGMVAVNDNTGGMEVSLAFGGNKESGIASEKGSDSWKNYMRRQSISMNYSNTPPAAAGIDFGG